MTYDRSTPSASLSITTHAQAPLAAVAAHCACFPYLVLSCLILSPPPLTDLGNDQPKQENPEGLGSSSSSTSARSVGIGPGPGGADGPGTLPKEPVWRDSDNSDSGDGGGSSGGGGGQGGRWAYC